MRAIGEQTENQIPAKLQAYFGKWKGSHFENFWGTKQQFLQHEQDNNQAPFAKPNDPVSEYC